MEALYLGVYKLVLGEVWINGKPVAVRLCPHFSDYGFSLQNVGRTKGPHTKIGILPGYFEALVSSSAANPFSIPATGSDLGHIDECQGYAAVDVGPGRRKVSQAELVISKLKSKVRFEFSGVTAPREITDYYKAAEPYEFFIWFDVPDEDFPIYIKNAGALKAIKLWSARVKPLTNHSTGPARKAAQSG